MSFFPFTLAVPLAFSLALARQGLRFACFLPSGRVFSREHRLDRAVRRFPCKTLRATCQLHSACCRSSCLRILNLSCASKPRAPSSRDSCAFAPAHSPSKAPNAATFYDENTQLSLRNLAATHVGIRSSSRWTRFSVCVICRIRDRARFNSDQALSGR